MINYLIYIDINTGQDIITMGLAASRQWNEMNEVNKALEEAQADTQAKQKETVTSSGGSGEKKSLINKMRSRILKSGK